MRLTGKTNRAEALHFCGLLLTHMHFIFKSIKEIMDDYGGVCLKGNTSMAKYSLITPRTNFSFKKDTAQHHQLALGLSAE